MEMDILSLFTDPHVIPNPCAFLSCAEHKKIRRLITKEFQFPLTSIVFCCPYNDSLWEPKQFGYQHSLKYVLMCYPEQSQTGLEWHEGE